MPGTWRPRARFRTLKRPALLRRALDERRIDLHTHTIASDGTLTPTALVELAARKGLAAIAITDHDTLAAIPDARAVGEKLGVEVIAGVELSVSHAGADVHLLGYFVDPTNAALAERLARFRAVREQRGARMVERLRELGVDITLAEVMAEAKGAALGRPHVARALVAKGIVKSIPEAFDQWLADGRPAHVPKEKLGAQEAIALVHGARGVAVLAHPGLLPEASRYRIIHDLAALGLDGVEVEHSRHSSEERHRLRDLARELDLVETGGSDFHGENKPGVDLGYGHQGNVRVTVATLAELRRKNK